MYAYIIHKLSLINSGQEYHYNEYVIIGFGSTPAALMKSGCTITTLIALDRICALWAPMKYYSLKKKLYV